MGMTIDDAIKKYKNNAEYERTHGNLQGCQEFRQLAKWLEELRRVQDARIKADMVAMLTEIQLEIAEFMGTISPNYDEAAQDISLVIQQKIDKYKAESEAADGNNYI